MSELREYFRRKALSRIRFALKGQAFSDRAIEAQINAVAASVNFEHVDGLNRHQRRHPNPKKRVHRIIEDAVKAIRAAGPNGVSGLAVILRDVVDRLRRKCKEFWSATDPGKRCDVGAAA